MMSSGALGCVDRIFTLRRMGEKAREKERRVYVGFIDLERAAYNRVNGVALWQVLRVCDVGGELLNRIESIYVDSSACVGMEGGISEQFGIDSGVR